MEMLEYGNFLVLSGRYPLFVRGERINSFEEALKKIHDNFNNAKKAHFPNYKEKPTISFNDSYKPSLVTLDDKPASLEINLAWLKSDCDIPDGYKIKSENITMIKWHIKIPKKLGKDVLSAAKSRA